MSTSLSPIDSIRVAAIQLGLRAGKPDWNLALVRETAERVHGRDPFDLLVLPECFNGAFDEPDCSVSAAAREFLGELAGRLEICIVGGSMEWRSPDGALFNTTFVYDPLGREVGSYHKRILFGREANRRTAGDSAGVFELRGWRIGVLTCADCWHPELARELVNRADILCVPAETVVPTRDHIVYARTLWHTLSMTRAEENALPVVVSDWAEGALSRDVVEDGDERGRFTSGATTIVDPSARPAIDRIQRTLPNGEAGALVVTIERERLAQFRAYRRGMGLLPGPEL